MRLGLEQLEGTRFDVAIIGGGINGAGAARAFAEQGFSVLLVEKADYASGATAASARMQHVGLRYLAPGGSMLQFLLHPSKALNAVRMAGMAKAGWAAMPAEHPQLFKRIKLCFPIYEGSDYKGWQLDLAFSVLKNLPPRASSPNYERYTGEAMNKSPFTGLLRDRHKLRSMVVFDDYQIDWPERLCLNDVVAAEKAGAIVRNYTVASIGERVGNTWSIGLQDVPSGEAATIVASSIVNAAGAWIDEVNCTEKTGALVQPAKGTLIMGQLPSDCRGWGMFGFSRQNQPLVVMPSRGMHFFGPTETAYGGHPDEVRPLEDEINYLADEVEHMLPGAGFRRSDVKFAWSGLRPHTRHPDHPDGYRSLVVHDLAGRGARGQFAVTGGVIGSYRDTVKAIVSAVTQTAVAPAKSGTPERSTPDATGHNFANLSDKQRIAVQEQVVHLDDLLFRRTGEAWSEGMAVKGLEETARELGAVLGWSNQDQQNEIGRFKQILKERHAAQI